MIDLNALHFLRPWGLLLMLAGLLLPLLWRRRQRSWGQLIAPELLPYLTVTATDSHRLRPIHLTSALLVMGGLALAGPSWQQDQPPFAQNQAPLILAVDLSPSMAATDVAPSRLALAKLKLQALAERNPGTATGLVAYRGSAHLVLPPSRDPQLFAMYLNALTTDLVPAPGRDVAAAIEQALSVLPSPDTPATLVLVTDEAGTTPVDVIRSRLQQTDLKLLMLVTGHELGADRRRNLERFAAAIGADLGSATANQDDLEWIERHARQHYRQASVAGEGVRWRDAGYWLVWPTLLLSLLAFRRGWRVHGCALPLLLTLTGSYPSPLQANPLADAFLTPDQQGRLAFEAGRYADAARLFDDRYLKGLAYYRSADYALAIVHLQQVDTAEARFYLGNSYARQLQFGPAIAAYDRALALRSPFPQAAVNRALCEALAARLQQERQRTPDIGADDIRYDNGSNAGKTTVTATTEDLADQLWLDSLTSSPGEFLRQKFRHQRSLPEPGP